MKKRYIYLLLISLLSLNNIGFSQYINYEDDKGWNLGFNMGGAWQPREVTSNATTIPYAGFSGGLTFGKSIIERPGGFFGLDWRFRYLQGWNSGWETTASPLPIDSTVMGYRNYKMIFNEYSLEAVITLNRLRERTGIILYGFGGVGLNNYAVRSNYTDFTGYYDYSQIDPNASDIQIAKDLRRFDNDNNWETLTKARSTEFMPSLGWGLGYQFGPHFSMGAEWKTTYALNDHLDGIKNGVNDRYNYASWFFRWNLFSSGRTTYTVPNNNNNTIVNNNNSNNTNNNINNWTDNSTTPRGNKPLVNITNPSATNMSVSNSAFTVMANVYYVATAQDVIFKQNGTQLYNFTFDPNTNKLVAGIVLQPGNNVIEIIGKNQYGSDADSKIIVLQQPVPVMPPPVVTITNPPYSPYSVASPNFTVTATILNITSASQIAYKVNGVNSTNFYFNTNSNLLSSSLVLHPGSNTIQITATNAQGSSTQSATIVYEAVTVQPPVVTINFPNQNPYTTNSSLQSVTATVLNVNSMSQTQVVVNGNAIQNYTFNPSTHKLVLNAVLIDGTNFVQITGTNAAGMDSKTQTIVYNKPQTMPKPVVTFTAPSTSPFNVSVSNMTIKAKVFNVSGSDDITVTANGSNVPNFTFNNLTKEVVFNVNLLLGNNVFTVKGTNAAGYDQKQAIVVYSVPDKVKPPVITITNPGTNPYATSLAQEVINAEILNVNNVSGVSATFNGSAITNFTFDPVTKKFVYNASLINGANVLTINAVNTAGTASKSQTIIYTPQTCLTPVITLVTPSQNPFNTTNSKGFIELNIQNGGTIDFKINGQSTTAYNYNASTGKFTHMVARLNEGANVFTITVTNDCGSTTENITTVYAGDQPCDAPAVNFINPVTNPFNFTGKNPNFSFSASVVNAAGQNNVTVKHNGSPVVFNYDGVNYIVSSNVVLTQGANNFEVSASNNCGTTSKTIVVSYGGITTQLPAPDVILSSPSSFPHSTTNSSVTVSGKVLNVATKNDISVLFDGQAISSFTFNTTSKAISIPLTLSAGSHTLSVTGTNSEGTDNETVELILTGNAPVVTISNYSSQTTTSNPTVVAQPNVTVQGAVQNYQGATFTVKVNGSNYTNYTYSSTNGQYSIPLTLIANQVYAIEITASNQFGTDSKTTHLKYFVQPPCNDPVISVNNPVGGFATLTTATGSIAATISNATSVSFKIDGQNSTAFTFNANSGAFTANNITLHKGSLYAEITATNDCGSVSTTVTLNHEVIVPDCLPPVLTFVTPSSNPVNYTNSSSAYAVNINTQNVDANSTISVTLNNSPVNLTYNSRGNNISGTVNLVEGTNTIQVTVTNDCGTATISTTVNYSAPTPDPEPCGPRFNPGNSDWEFCLITPSGTYNRSDLASNSGFTYTGSASSLFFKPIAGGGSAIVNGQPYNVTPGQYYLFTGSLTVDVSSSHPGSMGQWEVCVSSNSSPTHGSGNNRPASPCEVTNNNNNNGNSNNSNGNSSNNGSNNIQSTPLPIITLSSPTSFPHSTTNSAVTVSGKVENVSNKNDIAITFDGQAVSAFTFIPTTDIISIPLTLSSAGSHTLAITATNTAGSDNESVELILTGNPPVVAITSFTGVSSSTSPITLSEELASVAGTIQNFVGATVTATVNGTAVSSLNYYSSNGQYTLPLTLDQNQVYAVVISASNQFGNDSETIYLEYEVEEVTGPNEGTLGANAETGTSALGSNNSSSTTTTPCGPRFNPGNSTWEFCLVTPSGNYTRDDLASNSNFTYTGSATSLYFKPIAGGGNAIVNGQEYTVSAGSYYLFTGNLTVDVSSSHPGSMGHWEVCITSNAAPISGNGNNRPTSPCEVTNTNNSNNNSNSNSSNNSNSNNSNNGNNGNNGNHSSSNVNQNNTIQNANSSIDLKEKQYSEAIKKADMYYNARKWASAKTYYEQALKIKPNESYPKARLAIVNNKLKPTPTPRVNAPTNNKVVKPTGSSSTSKPNTTTNKTTTTTTKPSSTTKVNTTPTKRTSTGNNASSKTTTETEKKTEEEVQPTIKPKIGGR